MPTVLFLAGFDEIVTVDITRWMNRERQRTALARVLDYHDRGELNIAPSPDRVAVLREVVAAGDALSFDQVNERLRLTYRVEDARHLDYPDGHFALTCSNNVLEHVHAPVLGPVLSALYRHTDPAGDVMSHFVDLSDHFAHLDPTITVYNFLRFSQRQWKLIDNDIQPQNRLRWPDYRRVYANHGIPIRGEEALRPGDLAALRSVPLHAEYAGYSEAELAVTHGYLVS